MKRRNFIRVAVGVAAQAAVVPTYLLAGVGDEEDVYREAFRERCRRLAEQGYEIRAFWLFPPNKGFRYATVFHSRGKIEFYQPWGAAAGAWQTQEV